MGSHHLLQGHFPEEIQPLAFEGLTALGFAAIHLDGPIGMPPLASPLDSGQGCYGVVVEEVISGTCLFRLLTSERGLSFFCTA